MSERTSGKHTADPAKVDAGPGGPEKGSTTPGRPTDASSRQQTHANQNSQSGSPALDKEHTRRSGGGDKAPKPADAK